jgi:hypothetical protein
MLIVAVRQTTHALTLGKDNQRRPPAISLAARHLTTTRAERASLNPDRHATRIQRMHTP